MSDFVLYLLSFAILGGVIFFAELVGLRLAGRVRRIGVLPWTGGAVLLGGGPVVIGIALSAPYPGLLLGIIGSCGWIYGTLRVGPTGSDEEPPG